ncbi:MAG: hypothetical protein GY820_40230 [Gammaproteobacteria bacterium]|nr:hypothetical protein [Gammaproteobacteria bacterium]
MLNFDLMDTVAGQQIYEEGVEDGILKEARDVVIEALTERFIIVPAEIKESVYSAGDRDILKALHRYAIRSSDIEEFKKVFSKISSAS